MRIEELSDEQKTVMLARLCGWGVSTALGGTSYESIFIYTQDNERCVDLYDVANMALSWRVLNWAAAHGITTQINVVYQYKKGDWARMIDLPPADAQRAWLDYILRKAIEAGMVADDE